MRHLSILSGALLTAAAALAGLSSLTSCNHEAYAHNTFTGQPARNMTYSVSGTEKTITFSNKEKTVVRKVGKFNSIQVHQAIRVVYSPNEMETKVVVSAPDNVVEYLTTTVKDGCLNVRYEGVNIQKGSSQVTPTVYVTGRDVSTFKAMAAGAIMITSEIMSRGKVDMEAHAAGVIVAEKPIIAREVEVSVSSAASVKLNSVRVTSLALSSSAAATVMVGEAQVSGPLAANASAEGIVTLNDVTALAIDAGAAAGGMIRLMGSCPNATYEASQSGTIMAAGLKCTDCSAVASENSTVVVDALNLKASTYTGGTVHNQR